eukprot:953351-Pelagomonas_calceolata.AAC.2
MKPADMHNFDQPKSKEQQTSLQATGYSSAKQTLSGDPAPATTNPGHIKTSSRLWTRAQLCGGITERQEKLGALKKPLGTGTHEMASAQELCAHKYASHERTQHRGSYGISATSGIW